VNSLLIFGDAAAASVDDFSGFEQAEEAWV